MNLINDIPGYNSTLFVDGYESFGIFTSMGIRVRKNYNLYNPQKLVTLTLSTFQNIDI